jgi:putative transposase
MHYRRDYTEGATYFFTAVTFRRKPLFSQAEAVDGLRLAFREEMARRLSTIDAIVIMPDHLHAIWTLPLGDSDYSIRWRNIKRAFTATIPSVQRAKADASRQKKHEQTIWQRRCWEHRIRDEQDFEHHVDCIHYNPVKHGYVSRPVEWLHSSIHRYIREGVLSPDWGGNIQLPEGIGHE